jgi:hypothetical protein
MRLALLLSLVVCVLFVPLDAFAITKSIHDVHYKAGAPADIVPFLVLGGMFLVALYGYYKSSHVGKYDKFTLHCTKCGSFTRGLKCVICEARK